MNLGTGELPFAPPAICKFTLGNWYYTAHCEKMHLWHKQYWDKWAQERSRRLNYGQDFDESPSRTAISDLTQKLSMPNGKES